MDRQLKHAVRQLTLKLVRAATSTESIARMRHMAAVMNWPLGEGIMPYSVMRDAIEGYVSTGDFPPMLLTYYNAACQAKTSRSRVMALMQLSYTALVAAITVATRAVQTENDNNQ